MAQRHARARPPSMSARARRASTQAVHSDSLNDSLALTTLRMIRRSSECSAVFFGRTCCENTSADARIPRCAVGHGRRCTHTERVHACMHACATDCEGVRVHACVRACVCVWPGPGLHAHARAPSPKKIIAYLKPTVHSVPAGDVAAASPVQLWAHADLAYSRLGLVPVCRY